MITSVMPSITYTTTSFVCENDNHFCSQKKNFISPDLILLTIQTSCCNNPTPSANQPTVE
jgi:hypothetical protein